MPYCVNCGHVYEESDNFCRNCGNSLKIDKIDDEVRLVEVNLIGGVKRRLYYYKNEYYLDSECNKKYTLTNLIEGKHKIILNKKINGPKVYFFGINRGIIFRVHK